jgi:hypothetical protein
MILQWRGYILDYRIRMKVNRGDGDEEDGSFLYRDIRFNDLKPLVLTQNQEFTLYQRHSEDTSSLQGANIGSWNIYSVSLNPSYRYELIVRTRAPEPNRVIPINELFKSSSGRFEIDDITEWVYSLPPEISNDIQTPERTSISLRMR